MPRYQSDKASIGHICSEIMGMTFIDSCFPKDPTRARRELIEQYNRKPDVYVESNITKDCLKLFNGASTYLSGVIRQATASLVNDNKKTAEQHKARSVASGAPSCDSCDVIDASIFKALQRAICYAGAGLGIVGIGVVTLFGLCTAAGGACTITVCNKFADKNCNLDTYDPAETEVQYEGKPVLYVQNSYTPTCSSRTVPAEHPIPVNNPIYRRGGY